jgi:hypothetical protein
MNDDGESQTPAFFVCSCCEYTTGYKKDYHRHLLSKKHLKRMENKDANTDVLYHCECCDFQTIYKYNYDIHVKSQKHLLKQNQTTQNIQENQCEFCRKIYSNNKNLWRHKKICKQRQSSETLIKEVSMLGKMEIDVNESEIQETNKQPGVESGVSMPITPELFMQMYKQNSDFQMLMMEQQKYILEKMESLGNQNNNNTTNSNNSITMTNSNNKTFNIQFFLNEYCKNAIDIHDFVRSLNYSTENLEETMKLGYVGGISKMMTDKIRITPVEERPIHCCDEKREKLYIRNNGEWVSGSDSAEILQSIIADIANNNYRTFQQWVRENPSCMTLDTPAYEKYMIIYRGVIGSRSDDEETKHVKKILTNILHDIVIEKDKYLM